ncbi:MAG: undecaprenyl-diphosphate phosphatase [Actinomycetota bacterium]|nr:undecaprenyl-diphosphate phosphatase [Actinomycetota bacterium]
MLIALLWGLVQGLTEFLPVSSSGHLVLVPVLLGLPPPGLATSAVLHLGTLLAVLAYYRTDLVRMARFRNDAQGRHLVVLLVVGTIPAGILGLTLEGPLSVLFASPQMVAAALIGTALILFAAGLVPMGLRRIEETRVTDALLVGLAQGLALIPGISRSGATIAAGLSRRLDGREAARFSFLLAIPAIAGAGLFEALQLGEEGELDPSVLVGVLSAAVSGYAAIAVLVRAMQRFGLAPFAWYCLLAGTAALLLVP